MPLIDADQIRDYLRRRFIDPARASNQRTVQIVAGDVHRSIGLSNRVPQVCQALTSTKFLKENRLELEKAEGPASGLSTTMTYTYRLLDSESPAHSAPPPFPFAALRGSAKEIFRSLGGGGKFIESERRSFYASGNES